MSSSKHMPDLQAQLNRQFAGHQPPAPPPQMRTPAWKEGSPEWLAEMRSTGRIVGKEDSN